jgi:glyoxylase-like metal-dependent hydrolase (beta-lactamase superfamily II)
MDGLTTIEIPTPFGVGTVNCYAIDAGELTLIDPGPSFVEATEALETGLDEIGYAIADVDNVLITHGHMDHFGLAGRIRSESGARVMLHEIAVPKVTNPDEYYRDERDYFTPFFKAHGVPGEIAEAVTKVPEPFTRFHAPTEVDVPLADGDAIDVGISLECIETPGHSKDGIAFHWTDEGALFTGDHVLDHITPNPTLQMPREEGGPRPRSLVEYLDSIRALQSLDVDVGYPGHGVPITDLETRLGEVLDHHHDRKEEFLAFVEREPTSAYDIMKAYFENLPLTEYFLGLSEVIGHMDLLEAEGRVEVVEDGIRRYAAV